MAERTEDEPRPELLLRKNSISWTQGHIPRGTGSFGAVYDVKVNGFPCIAKRLHDVLRQVDGTSGQDDPSVCKRFLQECTLLSTLRHPNVVQFIGIHKAEGLSGDVSLVMEGLHTDLDKFLEKNPEVPQFLKLSFLLDTSNALVYLHMHSPPVIHRDVKAANVLLGRDMQAKLADLGTSKLLNLHPLSTTIQTRCPGTMGIMPPEALQSQPIYGTELDVFSFGTLILHTVNQEFPVSIEVSAAKKKGEMQITKRLEAVEKLKNHCLYELTKQCLQDNPGKRPSMVKARDTIEKKSTQHSHHVTNFYEMYREIEGLKKALEKQAQQASYLALENTRLQNHAKKAQEAKEVAEAQAEVFKADFELERKDRQEAAGKYDQSLCQLETQIKDLTSQLQLQKAEKIRLEQELKEMKLKANEGVHKSTSKTIGGKRTTLPRMSVATPRTQDDDDCSDLLQSLRFDAAKHSSHGYRCSNRYEWYQTSSDVYIDIMIPNVKKDDIIVRFTDTKVKVFIRTKPFPYNLSLHVFNNIIPDKCFMKVLKSKVELKMRKAEGMQWLTLDNRGMPTTTTDAYFQKWDSIAEEDGSM